MGARGSRIINSIVEYDPEDNMIYVKLTDKKIVSTVPIGNAVFIDISDDNKPVGIKYFLTDQSPETINEVQSLFLS
jgi:uncharacterized protein YuzE